MNNDFSKDLVNNFIKYLKENGITEYSDISKEIRKISDTLTNEILEKQEVEKKQIISPNLVVEVIDSNNGQLYRRYLEIEYVENANGIRLKGEDLG